jgi:hypothetical protein
MLTSTSKCCHQLVYVDIFCQFTITCWSLKSILPMGNSKLSYKCRFWKMLKFHDTQARLNRFCGFRLLSFKPEESLSPLKCQFFGHRTEGMWKYLCVVCKMRKKFCLPLLMQLQFSNRHQCAISQDESDMVRDIWSYIWELSELFGQFHSKRQVLLIAHRARYISGTLRNSPLAPIRCSASKYTGMYAFLENFLAERHSCFQCDVLFSLKHLVFSAWYYMFCTKTLHPMQRPHRNLDKFIEFHIITTSFFGTTVFWAFSVGRSEYLTIKSL